MPLRSTSLKDELARVLVEKVLMPKSLILESCTPFWQMTEWIEPKNAV
jgi:hypothetical protein